MNACQTLVKTGEKLNPWALPLFPQGTAINQIVSVDRPPRPRRQGEAMNASKTTSARWWKKWAKAGAVAPGNAVVEGTGKLRSLRFFKPTALREVLKVIERCGWRPVTIEELQRRFNSPAPLPREDPWVSAPYLRWNLQRQSWSLEITPPPFLGVNFLGV